jgi:hypothetical protein
MTPQERLKLYETALIDWNLIPIMGFEFEDTKSRITCLENAIKLTKEKFKL